VHEAVQGQGGPGRGEEGHHGRDCIDEIRFADGDFFRRSTLTGLIFEGYIMPLKTVCPNCKVPATLPTSKAGSRVLCPNCKKPFKAPASDGDAEAVALQDIAPKGGNAPAPAAHRSAGAGGRFCPRCGDGVAAGLLICPRCQTNVVTGEHMGQVMQTVKPRHIAFNPQPFILAAIVIALAGGGYLIWKSNAASKLSHTAKDVKEGGDAFFEQRQKKNEENILQFIGEPAGGKAGPETVSGSSKPERLRAPAERVLDAFGELKSEATWAVGVRHLTAIIDDPETSNLAARDGPSHSNADIRRGMAAALGAAGRDPYTCWNSLRVMLQNEANPAVKAAIEDAVLRRARALLPDLVDPELAPAAFSQIVEAIKYDAAGLGIRIAQEAAGYKYHAAVRCAAARAIGTMPLSKECGPLLLALAADREPRVRQAAGKALADRRRAESLQDQMSAALKRGDPDQTAVILRAFGGARLTDHAAEVVPFLNNEAPADVRRAAVDAARLGLVNADAWKPLAECLRTDDFGLAEAAAESLARDALGAAAVRGMLENKAGNGPEDRMFFAFAARILLAGRQMRPEDGKALFAALLKTVFPEGEALLAALEKKPAPPPSERLALVRAAQVLLEDPAEAQRIRAIETLAAGAKTQPWTTAFIAIAAADPGVDLRRAALFALRDTQDPWAAAPLIILFGDPRPSVSYEAARIAAGLPDAVPLLKSAARSWPNDLRRALAARALDAAGDPLGTALLREVLNAVDPHPDSATIAIRTLAEHGDPALRESLLAEMGADDGARLTLFQRARAADALARIAAKDGQDAKQYIQILSGIADAAGPSNARITAAYGLIAAQADDRLAKLLAAAATPRDVRLAVYDGLRTRRTPFLMDLLGTVPAEDVATLGMTLKAQDAKQAGALERIATDKAEKISRRIQAIIALGGFNDRSETGFFIQQMRSAPGAGSDDTQLREACHRALEIIYGSSPLMDAATWEAHIKKMQTSQKPGEFTAPVEPTESTGPRRGGFDGGHEGVLGPAGWTGAGRRTVQQPANLTPAETQKGSRVKYGTFEVLVPEGFTAQGKDGYASKAPGNPAIKYSGEVRKPAADPAKQVEMQKEAQEVAAGWIKKAGANARAVTSFNAGQSVVFENYSGTRESLTAACVFIYQKQLHVLTIECSIDRDEKDDTGQTWKRGKQMEGMFARFQEACTSARWVGK
jgi:hypothetical protein